LFELPVRNSEKTGSDATAFPTAGDQLISVGIDPGAVGAIGTGKPVKMSFPASKLDVFDA
jgi:multiple sugar transport system ATP-binding protein